MTTVRTLRRASRLRTRAVALGLAAGLSASVLAACSEVGDPPSGASADAGDDQTQASSVEEEPSAPPVEVSVNVKRNATSVPVDRMLKLDAENGTLKGVRVTSSEGPVKGRLTDDGAAWRATSRLEPGLQYAVKATTLDEAGESSPYRNRFRTADLTLDQQTYPSIAPLDGETVGIGMPVIVKFDIPVTNRKAIERHLTVTSSSKQLAPGTGSATARCTTGRGATGPTARRSP